MPFSAIKIDKSFVGELETSSDSLMIVRSVIQLARDMGLASVAEGVVSANTARLLTELGIDGLQGHYFSQPLPLDGFAAWLEDGHAIMRRTRRLGGAGWPGLNPPIRANLTPSAGSPRAASPASAPRASRCCAAARPRAARSV